MNDAVRNTIVATILALSTAACANYATEEPAESDNLSSSGPPEVSISSADDGTDVTVPVGQEFKIVLANGADYASGFKWTPPAPAAMPYGIKFVSRSIGAQDTTLVFQAPATASNLAYAPLTLTRSTSKFTVNINVRRAVYYKDPCEGRAGSWSYESANQQGLQLRCVY